MDVSTRFQRKLEARQYMSKSGPLQAASEGDGCVKL